MALVKQRGGRGERETEHVGTVALKPPHFFGFFYFQNFSQFHIETSKTCNMKVVQKNESYNFSF
jgi:hypothetical protein